jgi:hypothetical protein
MVSFHHTRRNHTIQYDIYVSPLSKVEWKRNETKQSCSIHDPCVICTRYLKRVESPYTCDQVDFEKTGYSTPCAYARAMEQHKKTYHEKRSTLKSDQMYASILIALLLFIYIIN